MNCICALRVPCSHPADHPQSTVSTASHQHQNHHRLLKHLLGILSPAYSSYLLCGDATPVVQFHQVFYVEPQPNFSEKQHLIVILAPTDTCGQFHWTHGLNWHRLNQGADSQDRNYKCLQGYKRLLQKWWVYIFLPLCQEETGLYWRKARLDIREELF